MCDWPRHPLYPLAPAFFSTNSNLQQCSPNYPTITLAKRLCRTPDWLDPPRIPGSCNHPERGPSTSTLNILPCVLPPIAQPLVAREGLSGSTPGTATRSGQDHRLSAGRRTPSSLRAAGCLIRAGLRNAPSWAVRPSLKGISVLSSRNDAFRCSQLVALASTRAQASIRWLRSVR